MPRKTIICLATVFGVAVFLAVLSPLKEAPKAPAPDTGMAASPQNSTGTRRPNHRRTAVSEETAGARIAKLLEQTGDGHLLSDFQIAAYLQANRTNALSLVTAFEATHNREYLRMAAAAFPDDPFVQTKVLFHNVLPEKRAETIEALKLSDSKNSLPNLLAAQDRMEEGDVAGALAEITTASQKQFNDYTRESIAGLEEAYLASGHTVVDAKALGSSSLLLPQLAPLKQLASQAADMAIAYRDSGDTESQKMMLEASWAIGTQLRDSANDGTLLNYLVGMAAQNMALARWPETEQPDFLNGISAADQWTANQAMRKEIRESTSLFQSWLPTAPEHEIITYYDRQRSFGELNAMNWLRERQPDFVPVENP